MDNNIMIKVLIGTVLLAALLTVGQIWMTLMTWDIFFKAIGTLAIIFVVTGFLMVVGHDFGSKKNLKDENYLD